MQFEDKQAFNKPVETVLKMFSDRAYFENKYKMLRFANIEVLEHALSETAFRIKVRYEARNDAPLPAFAKKIIGETNTVIHEDSWDLVKKTGRLSIEIKGVPVRISTEMRLLPEGEGAANHLKWTVGCSIPLIGGKLEQLLGDDIRSKSRIDHIASRKLLEAY